MALDFVTTEFDIRRSVSRYIGGEAGVRDLRAELAPASGSNMVTPEAVALIRQIEGRLAEFAHGDWSEDELRELLSPFGGFWILEGPNPSADANADTFGEPQELVTIR